MCGVLGVFGLGSAVSLDDRAVERMRDLMAHRGPDGAGLWRCPWAVFAHRRLAVVAPGPEGAQPMVTPDGLHALVYNGELYNDAEIRRELMARGVRFTTASDTETVLKALAIWGESAIPRFRGMYAFGYADVARRRVILARDPLGIKPLYAARVVTTDGPQVVFASEPPAVLAHPAMRTEPDWVTAAAYLASVRPTLGPRTMFAGLETLLPGETRVYDAASSGPPRVLDAWSAGGTVGAGPAGPGGTREIVAESVRSHLRSDVPTCALLSGGLDSAAMVSVIRAASDGPLNTYCAGARLPGADDDFAFGSEMARLLDTNHTEVEVTEDGFVERWFELVHRTGVPVSTPNEIAIYEVSRQLRADGYVVALSGEGADELFGGYGPPLMQAAQRVASLGGRPETEGGLFHLMSNAWITPGERAGLVGDGLTPPDADAAVAEAYRVAFDRVSAAAPGDSPLQAHLRFHRAINLPNLLRRLDSTTMLASVEGRTPFADARVARFAEALPMRSKFEPGDPPRTKIALRDAFRADLPRGVVDRPKASFPLPFQAWMSRPALALGDGDFARRVLGPDAAGVLANPAGAWRAAWPLLNLLMWGERWWGRGLEQGMSGAGLRNAVA